jgi:formamidopyrimidine-DNA glycosylase
VSPLAPAAQLGARRLAAVVRGMRRALALAGRDPGRYARGEATARLAVYGREGERCRRCGGRIARTVQAGRATYYCPACQPE